MITLLEYLVVAAVIGAIVFFLAVVVFGRGEQIAPLDPRTAPAELPESGISAADVRAVRFSMAVRGYRMSDVDWTLDRIGDELDELRRENAQLRVLAAEPDDGPVTAPLGEVVRPRASDIGTGGMPTPARGTTLVATPERESVTGAEGTAGDGSGVPAGPNGGAVAGYALDAPGDGQRPGRVTSAPGEQFDEQRSSGEGGRPSAEPYRP